ncbi:hypothetical protein D3C79_718810 [compost metagenome]
MDSRFVLSIEIRHGLGIALCIGESIGMLTSSGRVNPLLLQITDVIMKKNFSH